MTRKLYTFHGGIHLDDKKSLSNQSAIKKAPIASKLVIPLQQNIGQPSVACVAVGDKVHKGDVIAHAGGIISVPLHAPTSGTITAIDEFPIVHPSGKNGPAIMITPDGEDHWCELNPVENYLDLEPRQLRDIIHDAGIVGLGGAGFPAYFKLNPGAKGEIDTLIINGAECEPFITCDDRLMRERAEEIIRGALIMKHAVHASHCVVGIEDNKPEAYQSMVAAASQFTEKVEVVSIPTIYPTGGEKQLIQVLTGREVPSKGIPLDVNVICQNVATAAAIYQAIIHGKPLISRIITVSGDRAKAPQNFEVLIGTQISELIDLVGGATVDQAQVIVGGPMMGVPVEDCSAPVVKTTSAILLQDRMKQTIHTPCIRCGECANVCPIKLLPQQLYWHARARDFDTIQDFNLFDCIECGCCSYVCPSQIPLVHYYRFAKTEIWTQEREKRASDQARRRHDFKQMRKEREKAEKAAKAKAKKEALAAKKSDKSNDSKQAAIKAAMERAKARKAAVSGNESKPVVDDDKQEKIRQALERAKAKKALKEDSTNKESSIDDDKQAKIKAAVERSKAKKAAKAAASGDGSIPADEHHQEIKEAVERAKAKKAATTSHKMDEDKQAAIKAAIERSKAKKAEAAKRKAEADNGSEE